MYLFRCGIISSVCAHCAWWHDYRVMYDYWWQCRT